MCAAKVASEKSIGPTDRQISTSARDNPSKLGEQCRQATDRRESKTELIAKEALLCFVAISQRCGHRRGAGRKERELKTMHDAFSTCWGGTVHAGDAVEVVSQFCFEANPGAGALAVVSRGSHVRAITAEAKVVLTHRTG